MLVQAAQELSLDPSASWMVGDILDDVEAGHRAGCQTILVNNGQETEWKLTTLRKPDWIVSDLREAARCILSSLCLSHA